MLERRRRALAIVVLPWLLGSAALAEAEQLRDPTRPPAVAAATSTTVRPPPPPPPRLEGIWRRNDTHVALIDGRRLRSGDRVRGYRVVSIGERHVRLANAAGGFVDLELTPAIRLPPSRLARERDAELADLD